MPTIGITAVLDAAQQYPLCAKPVMSLVCNGPQRRSPDGDTNQNALQVGRLLTVNGGPFATPETQKARPRGRALRNATLRHAGHFTGVAFAMYDSNGL
jgi:hypothetical protein